MHDYAPLHLAVAAALANGAWLLPRRGAALQLRCWLLGYALWMAPALLLLRSSETAAPTPWELWPVTLALFAVLAFPAIAWRHLRH